MENNIKIPRVCTRYIIILFAAISIYLNASPQQSATTIQQTVIEQEPQDNTAEQSDIEQNDETIIAQIEQETEAIAATAEESSDKEEISLDKSEPTDQQTTTEATTTEPTEETIAESEQEASPTQEYQEILTLIAESKKLNIPLLGTFTFTIDATFSPTTLAPTTQITAKPEKATIDLNVIQLSNPILIFTPATGFTLKANLTCLGQDLGPITATIVFDKKINFIKFTGSLAPETTFKPFEKIPEAKKIPGLKDIAIKQLSLSFDANKNITFSGLCNLLGVQANVDIQVAKQNAQKSVRLKAKPTEAVTLTKLLPILNETPLKGLGFSDLQIVVSPQEYTDSDTGLTFNAGFSLVGTMQLEGPLFQNVRKLLPILPKESFVLCTIGDEPQFMLRVADHFSLGGDTSLENIFFNIQVHKQPPTGTRVEMGLKTKIKTKLPKEKDFSLFTGEVSIPLDPSMPTIDVKGTMQGTWNNVLNLKGISISEVAFELGASIATGFTPTKVAFAGTLVIGDKKVKMATKTSKDGEFVLYGKLDGELGLSDILSLANKTGLKIPKDKIPDFSLKNVEVKIAPQAATIGELIFTKGKTFIGELTIKGCDFLKSDSGNLKAMLNLTMDDISINGKGSMSAISLANVLKITGAGLDNKKGTPDDGPTIKLMLSPFEQSFVLSGEIDLLGIHSEADIDLSPTNARFATFLNIGPGLKAKAHGELIKSGSLPDFKITGELTALSTIPFDKKDLEEGTQILEENRDNVRKEFQGKLSTLEKKINEHQKAMEENPAYKKLLITLEETKGKIKSTEQEINKFESKLSGLDSEIKALERKLGIAFNLSTYQTIDIDSPLTKQALQLSFNYSQLDLYSIETKLDPIKLDLRTYNTQYPLLCWGWFEQTFVQPVQHHVVEPVKKHVVEPATQVVATVVQKTGVDGLAEKVGGKDAIEKLKTAGYDVAKIATNPANWDSAIKLAALKTAREMARVAFEAAKAPLNGLKLSMRGTEESIKNFDPEILKLRAEQLALTAEMGAKMTTLEAAIVTFKTTTLVAFPAIKWLTPLEIKKLSISANLRSYATGELPKISCDIKAFNAIEKTFTISADLKNIPSMLKKLALKIFLLK